MNRDGALRILESEGINEKAEGSETKAVLGRLINSGSLISAKKIG